MDAQSLYQIYEGAALIAGATLKYLNCLPEHNYQPDYHAISDAQWANCQLLFLCTPGNPSGNTLSLDTLHYLIRKAKEHDIVLISDECYSELYRREDEPPAGLLEAALTQSTDDALKNDAFKHCLAFHSLSKRSNLPGLRSGFVAGDAQLITAFKKYRTYHGCAMPLPHQYVSIAAWQDEVHVQKNRALYNEKYQAVYNILGDKIEIKVPQASFYLWPNLETDDEKTAITWLKEANVHVLPGQYLSRVCEV